jgi:4-oxalocrotonate tautomerase family enzyme
VYVAVVVALLRISTPATTALMILDAGCSRAQPENGRAMPHIVVYCPRLSRDRKAACVAALTDAFEKSTGLSAEHLVIHIEEHSYDNVGVGGRLLTDAFPELAERERAHQARERDG